MPRPTDQLKECHPVTTRRHESWADGWGGAAMFVQFICLGCSWKIACLVIRSRQAVILHACARGSTQRDVVIADFF
jgi:hypothetical protein